MIEDTGREGTGHFNRVSAALLGHSECHIDNTIQIRVGRFHWIAGFTPPDRRSITTWNTFIRLVGFVSLILGLGRQIARGVERVLGETRIETRLGALITTVRLIIETGAAS